MAKLTAQAYGQALFELATEGSKVSELLAEVKALKDVFTAESDFIRLMKHPQVTSEEKVKIIEDSLKGKISDDLIGLLVIMIEKDRFSDIIPVFEYFINAVNQLEKRGSAKVSTPAELSDKQKDSVKEKLLATTDYKEMDIDYEVDASLIGGMVIRIGDRVVDSSIRTQLNELKKDLLKAQV